MSFDPKRQNVKKSKWLIFFSKFYSIPNKREPPADNYDVCKSIDVCKVSYSAYRTDVTVNKIVSL